MAETLTIALDAMGGDLGPDMAIPGADLVLQANPDLRLLVFGDETRIAPWLGIYYYAINTRNAPFDNPALLLSSSRIWGRGCAAASRCGSARSSSVTPSSPCTTSTLCCPSSVTLFFAR